MLPIFRELCSIDCFGGVSYVSARYASPVTSSPRRWPFHPCMNTNSYLRLLLMVPAVCLLGFTGCYGGKETDPATI